MKRILFFIFVSTFYLGELNAQSDSLAKEINEDVWKPFITSFNSDNSDGFKAVHSKNLIRVTQDDRHIIGYDQYFQKVPDSIKLKWGNWKKSIELRFIQRIADKGKAFEVGYYKTTSTNVQTGEVRKGIGKFHVLMRKENGVWKILMDADTSEGASEELFNKAASLE